MQVKDAMNPKVVVATKDISVKEVARTKKLQGSWLSSR